MVDGIDHINIYSKGKTELGRYLSNFAHTPFNYSPYGDFASVEAFWYWYFTGQKHDELKDLYGYSAKAAGKALTTDKHPITDKDKEIILEAIRCKLRQNKYIRGMLKESSLPFKHYYDFGGKIIELPKYQWIVDEFERLRELLQR